MARKQWRCFFCDEVFTRWKDAAEHFGCDDACEADMPACKLSAHEGHLVTYIRRLEKEIRRYMSEDSDVMRSIMTLEADHRTALVRSEEDGYNKGVSDMRTQLERANRIIGWMMPYIGNMCPPSNGLFELNEHCFENKVGPNGDDEMKGPSIQQHANGARLTGVPPQ